MSLCNLGGSNKTIMRFLGADPSEFRGVKFFFCVVVALMLKPRP